MTGLPASRHRCTARFCTKGTASSGSSTPRSPRATITPSNAAMISSRFSTACGFSTLARTGRRTPSSSMMSWTSTMSAALRTNDRAMRSAPLRSAHRRSSRSFSDRAGTLTATPGRLNPLLSDTRPPSTTTVWTRGPSTFVTLSSMRPSSTRTRSPGVTSLGRPECVVETMFWSPGTSSVVTTNSAPFSRSTGPDAKRPSRIFGPCRSTRMPTPRPRSSAAARTFS